MADKGIKKESGPTEQRTVLKLKPVSYRVSLIYLGDKRIKAEDPPGGALPAADMPPPYRAKYALKRDDAILDPLAIIPNIVRGETPDEVSRLAATPAPDGNTANPPGDTVYKLTITDNHGTRTAENGDALGPGWDNKSNVAYYKERGWIPDVVPAVPFRVVVRKFIGDTPVDLGKPLKVVVEIKDPPEEFLQTDGPRRAFLQTFFAKYNRTSSNPVKGDDNAKESFKGFRPPTELTKATAVLKKVAYKDKPALDKAPTENGVVAFSDLSDAAVHKETRAAFDLQEVDEDGAKVGVADMAFVPRPVGGDNYRFLITVIDGDKDIRETNENGVAVELRDDSGDPIPAPRSYTTGRVVIWRRAFFSVCVRANGTKVDDLNWDDIATWYRKMFLEVSKPVYVPEVTRAAWEQYMKDNFASAQTAPASDFEQAKYEASVWPASVAANGVETPGKAIAGIEAFARWAISQACTRAGMADPNSNASKEKQQDGVGLCMLLCNDAKTQFAAGAYFGDRMFWVDIPAAGGAVGATSTTAHEFAHLKSIRHSYTTRPWLPVGTAGSTTNKLIIDGLKNCNTMDHDGQDAVTCLQAYSRGYDAEPCGMCALCMRFYERVEIQKDGEFRAELIKRHGPASIARLTTSGGSTFIEFVTGPITLSPNQTVDVCALGPERDAPNKGAPGKAHLNMSFVPRGEGTFWTADNAGVELSPLDQGGLHRLRVKAKTAGTSVVTYRSGKDPTASVTINVV